jgi:hypothetical protein
MRQAGRVAPRVQRSGHMDTPSPRAPEAHSPERSPAPRTPEPSRQIAKPLLILAGILAFMSFWTWGAQRHMQPVVDYSTLYAWVDQGKLASATLRDHHLDGTLKAPTKIDGEDATKFQTELPDRDDELLPLLRRERRHEVSR